MSNSKNTLIIEEASVTNPKIAPTKSAYTNASEDVNEAQASKEAQSSKTTHNEDSSVVVKKEVPGTDVQNLVFNRANIEALGNHVHLVDTDEENKLDMFCYVKCNETDNDLLKQCRGVVFNGTDLVMKAFPYTNEYNHNEYKEVSTVLGNFNDWSFYEAHEGALVRMFNFNGKWFVSTHRKLNAFRSKWASRESFGTSFKNGLTAAMETNPEFKASLPEGDNILDRFQSTLDVTKQYMFLIRNTKDNRIVCSAPPDPTVYHVGTFVNGVLLMTEDVHLPKPERVKVLDINELLSFVDRISYKDYQGVIGFTSDNRQIKILHKDYQDLFRARGNEPSIKFRYLQVRMNRKFVNMLYHLYPEMTETFDEYENTLYDISRSIYRAYVQRFIKKRYVTVPREEFAIIRECHTWHLTNRTENRISINDMIRVLNQQSPTHLNHMIRRFKLEKTRQKEQDTVDRPRSDSMTSTKSFEKSPVVRNITPGVDKTPPPLIIGDCVIVKKKKSQTATILPRKPLYNPKSKDNVE